MQFKPGRYRVVRPVEMTELDVRSRFAFPFLLAAATIIWMAWVVVSLAWNGLDLVPLLPYLGFGFFIACGGIVGRILRGVRPGLLLPALVAMGAGVVLAAVHFYANAQAAWGLQLLALAGVIAVAWRTAVETDRVRSSVPIGLGLAALLAVLLVSRAQATTILVLPLSFIVLWTLQPRAVPARRVALLVGLGLIGVSALVVIGLGSLSTWPQQLNASGSLSSVRHQLWADALELWRSHPVLGAGPGAFVEHSPLASSRPDLHRAHSSILQIGAELGAVGVILFLCVLGAGALSALQGRDRAGLIAVSAWSALGIHSMIDHLYEYPIVTLTAGIVLGFAGWQPHGNRPADETLC